MRCFTVNYNSLNGILSPLFFISQPQDTKNFIPLSKIALVNPNRQKPQLGLDEAVPYVGLPETDDGEIKEILYRPYREVKGRSIFKENDILFARIEPSVFNQKYIYADGLRDNNYAFTSTEFYVVKAKEDVDSKFIFYMFFTNPVFEQIKGKTTGSTGRRRLDKGSFENLLIPFPNKEIRAKVVEILDQAQRQREEKLKQADELLNSIDGYVSQQLGIDYTEPREEKIYIVNSKDLEGNRQDPYYYNPKFALAIKEIRKSRYKTEKLENVINTLTSGQRPKGGVRIAEGNVVSIGGEHILDDYSIATNNLRFITSTFHKKHLASKTNKNDIFIVKDGATTGKVGIMPNDYPYNEVNINEHIFLIRAKKNVNPYYLFIFLKSHLGKIQIEQQISGGTVTGITREATKNLIIIMPPLSIQTSIAQEVRKRIYEAKKLKTNANTVLEEAKRKVEQMILN